MIISLKKKKILGAFPVNRLISQVPNILLYLHIDMCAKYFKKKRRKKSKCIRVMKMIPLPFYVFKREKD